jgi:hypothetical protein
VDGVIADGVTVGRAIVDGVSVVGRLAGSTDTLILLLVGGGLALGLPHVTARTRRRFWHPWINTGLLPLLGGILLGPASPFGDGWLSPDTARALQPFLAVALAAAGVLLGTQIRPAYFNAAGWPFIRRESMHALITFTALALPAGAVAWWLLPHQANDLGTWAAVAVGGLAGAAAVATTQRLPSEVESLPHHQLVMGHVVPAGWWNLLACGLGALALGVGDRPGQGLGGLLLAMVLPAVLGLLLGRTATSAPSRAEALVLLPAVLALAGGLALAVGGAPLLTGMVIGCLLANAGGGRAVLVERAMDELEQPVAIAAGLLAGLCLEPLSTPPAAWLVLLILPARWWLRSTRLAGSPTRPEVVCGRDRRLASSGATGVLLVAGASLAPAPLSELVVPLTVMFAVGTLVADVADVADVTDVAERRPVPAARED